ncbi:MAG: hypothetical protein JNK53_01255 [Phycisphaerae bacterium]|nr:hypothetical protein [Phycisphaerae bacterium]
MSAISHAEFAEGNLAYIQGVAGPQNGYTYWGSNINGQYHALGATAQTYNDTFAPSYFVSVTSWVNSPWSVTFSFDFSQYNPGQYSLHAIEIIGLKNDGSLASVSASQGTAWVQDGNKIRWDGNGASLANDPKLVLVIEQVPGPGALALLAVTGLCGSTGLTASRRRRA